LRSILTNISDSLPELVNVPSPSDSSHRQFNYFSREHVSNQNKVKATKTVRRRHAKNASTVTLHKSLLISDKLLINKMLVNKESKKKTLYNTYHHGVLENGGAVQSDQSEKK
jgi:hypothetical protein